MEKANSKACKILPSLVQPSALPRALTAGFLLDPVRRPERAPKIRDPLPKHAIVPIPSRIPIPDAPQKVWLEIDTTEGQDPSMKLVDVVINREILDDIVDRDG